MERLADADDVAEKPKDVNDADVRVGRRVRALRLERDLSLAELAAKTGISIGALSQIERGMSSLRVQGDLAAGRRARHRAVGADRRRRRCRQRSLLRPRRRAGGSLPVRSEGIAKQLLSPPAAALTGLLVTVEPGGGTAKPTPMPAMNSAIVLVAARSS